jgi:hypothetical protein
MRINLTASLLLVAAIASAQDSTTTATVAPAATPAPSADTTKAVVQPPAAPVAATTVCPPPAVPDTSKPKPPYWKKELVANFNVASSYFHGWSQGGEDNLAWTIKLLGSAEREGIDWNWANKASAEFGQIKLGDQGIRKTSDELKGESVLSRKLSKFLNPFVSGAFQTQVARGYKYPSDTLPRQAVSAFLDPLNLTQSVGVGSKPTAWLQTRLGAALREVRTDEFPSYSDDAKTASVENWKVDPGAESVTELKHTFGQKLLLQSTLSLFSNFKGWDEATLDWTSTASFQFTRFINLNASGELRRDIQQVDAWQWKHVVSLGLTYSFL